MPQFCPYTSNDLPKVLQFVGKCFRDNQFKGYHPGDILHWMSSEYQGNDLETCFWLYEEKGELIAFAELSKGEGTTYTLITDPKLCRSGDELALLTECQSIMHQRMKQNPPDNRMLSTHVAASDQRQLEHLTNLGYHIKPSNLVVTLKSLNLPIPTPVVPDGFQIRSVAGEGEADLIAEVHSNSFGTSWTPKAYLKLMRTPGFDIERELVVVAPDGRFAAFLVYWPDPMSKAGLFEPVGCHEEFQRRGLARALMYEAMKRMVAAGMTKAIVEHNSDNEAATNLYASLGFREHFKTFDCEIHLDSER